MKVSLNESVIVISDKLDADDSFVLQISFSSLVAHSINFLSERRKFFQSFEGNLLTSEQVLELQSILYDLISSLNISLPFDHLKVMPIL